MKKVIKIKEKELLVLLEEHLNNPDKYDKRLDLIKNLKESKYYLQKSAEKMESAHSDAKSLPDEEIGITAQINKCWLKLKKEISEISILQEEVSKGDLQPKQDVTTDEKSSSELFLHKDD